MTELSALLNRSPLTARQASEKAGEIGVRLPYGTAAAYWAGTHPVHPKDETLQAIAEVTRIPVTRLRAAIQVGIGELKPWKPPPEANRLTHRQRRAIEQLIKAIVLEVPPSASLGVDEDEWDPAWAPAQG